MSGRARFLGPLCGFVFGLYLTHHAWGPRPPSGDDVMGIVVRSAEGSRVLRSLRLDGWSPRFLTGFPIFRHYGPGLAIAFTLVRLLTFGFLSSVGAIQVLMAVTFAAVAPAAWFLARSLGLNERAATYAGFFALVVNSQFGVGLAGSYSIGLVTHAAAAPFVLVGIGAFVRSVLRPDERQWIPAAAACFAIVIVTHVLSTLMAAMFMVVFAAVLISQRAGLRAKVDVLRRGAIIAAAASALSAFWLLPYVQFFGEHGPGTAWTTQTLHQRIDEIVSGQFLLGHYLALFVVAGWAWALLAWRKSGSLAFAAPVAAMAFLVVAHWYYAHSPGSSVAQQLANRGSGYAGILAIIPLGGFVDEVVSSFARVHVNAAAIGAVVAVLIAVVVPGRPHLINVARQQGAATETAKILATQLHQLVPPNGRFGLERDLPSEIPNFGMSHPDLWLAERTGRNTVNTFNLELSQSGGAGSTAENLRDDQGSIDAARFRRFGVMYIVTVEPKAHDRLLATNEFREVSDVGPIAILRVLAPPGTPDAKSLVTLEHGSGNARLDRVSHRGGHYDFTTRLPQSVRATIAVGWSSSWRVKIDGKHVPARKSADGLVSVALPRGTHHVSLVFHRDLVGALGVLIGLATAVALVREARRG